MVRALTRAEWLRVMARGFHAESKRPRITWQQNELEDLFEDLFRGIPRHVNRKWRMDILDAFSYMRERRSPRLPGHPGGDKLAV